MIVTCPECATRYDVADKAFSAGGRAVRCNHCGCEWYQIGPSAARPPEIEATFEETPAEQASTSRADLPREYEERAASGVRSRQPRRGAPAEDRLPLERRDQLASDPATNAAERARDVGRRAQGGRRPAREAAAPALVAGPKARRGFSLRALIFPLSGLALAGGAAAFLFLGPEAGLRGVTSSAPQPVIGDDPAPAALAAARPQPAVREGLVFVEFKYDLVERAEGPALEVWGRVANNGPEAALSPTIEIVSKDKEGQPLQRWLAQPDVESIAPGDSAKFSSRMMYPLEPVHDVEFFIAAR